LGDVIADSFGPFGENLGEGVERRLKQASP
jgi:hypothetical protein